MNSLFDLPNRLNSVPIKVGPAQTKWRQFRFPRSKKKRIRKKWSKDFFNYRAENDPYLYQIGQGLDLHFYCDPCTFAKLKVKLEEIK